MSENRINMELIIPKISIIVPVYNVEKYLYKCIDSILCQTFTDFELLLIDDGSSDRSGIICDEYAAKDKRVNSFHKANSGISFTRNYGIEQAKGEWIIFCDSDDWVDIDWLEQYYDALDEDVDLVFQGYVHENNNDQTVHTWKNCSEQNVSDVIYGLEQRDLFGWTWIKIFKKNIITQNAIRFNTTIPKNEDLVFTLEYCLHVHKIKILSTATYHYRNTPFSTISRLLSYKEAIRKNELIFKSRKQLYEKYPSNNAYYQWIVSNHKEQFVSALLLIYSTQYKENYESRKVILENTRLLIKDFIPVGKLNKIIVYVLKNIKNNFFADIFLKIGLGCRSFGVRS